LAHGRVCPQADAWPSVSTGRCMFSTLAICSLILSLYSCCAPERDLLSFAPRMLATTSSSDTCPSDTPALASVHLQTPDSRANRHRCHPTRALVHLVHEENECAIHSRNTRWCRVCEVKSVVRSGPAMQVCRIASTVQTSDRIEVVCGTRLRRPCGTQALQPAQCESQAADSGGSCLTFLEHSCSANQLSFLPLVGMQRASGDAMSAAGTLIPRTAIATHAAAPGQGHAAAVLLARVYGSPGERTATADGHALLCRCR
jgi:hypothetical protein